MSDSRFKLMHSYVHDHRIGVLVEISVNWEITTRAPEVRALVHDIAMHIAALTPVDIEELLTQGFVKDPSRTVSEVLSERSDVVADPIRVQRFVRWDAENNSAESPTEPPSEPFSNVLPIKRA